jgi:hypothetical protein
VPRCSHSWRVFEGKQDLQQTTQSKRGNVPTLHRHDLPREGHMAIHIALRHCHAVRSTRVFARKHAAAGDAGVYLLVGQRA